MHCRNVCLPDYHCCQWRSQEYELRGGVPSLAPYLSSLSSLPSPPPFNGVRGYNPRKFFEIKGVRR